MRPALLAPRLRLVRRLSSASAATAPAGRRAATAVQALSASCVRAAACRQCLLQDHRRPQRQAAVASLSAAAAARFASSSSSSSSTDTTSTATATATSSSPPLSAYTPQITREPAPLADAEYHTLADAYLDRLLGHLEDLQDAREDVDVVYASGVLTLAFLPSEATGGRARTYVINKQPPNKQIWLSSPVSGPKRFDWVLLDPAATGASALSPTDPAAGEWIYLKDGSALNELLRDEIGLDLHAAGEA